jgi:hypothetical protein
MVAITRVSVANATSADHEPMFSLTAEPGRNPPRFAPPGERSPFAMISVKDRRLLQEALD